MHRNCRAATYCLLSAIVFAVFSWRIVSAEDGVDATAVDFVRDIQPILSASCYGCHGPDEQEGSLRLDDRAIVMKGGVSGTLFEVGKAADGLLLKRLTSEDREKRMPLDEDRLSDAQIALISRWIDQGAPWPDGVGAQITELKKHWAYIAPQRPAMPAVKRSNWPDNAIDRFVLARLEHEGLASSPPADRARLIRRVYLDLIGLPPTVQQVQAFAGDDLPDAYERIVDDLLASPRYGEKWARQWLDMGRYADSNGYQADQIREMWAYRDWVINAMNADMPFDQFTREQIAGDLLPETTVDQRVATGFHRTPTCNVEAGVDPEENRTNQVIDRVNTTATVWLGTTLECAQCHNHKYDPFTQKDYYQLFAFFNNTPLEVTNHGSGGVSFDFFGPKMELPLSRRHAEQHQQREQRSQDLNEKIAQLTSNAKLQQVDWERGSLADSRNAQQTHLLEIDTFHSSGGSTIERLDDGSVLVGGKWPSNDTYTVTVDTDLQNITGFVVEALTHESLPDTGPGRGDTPNIILSELTVTAAPANASGDDAQNVNLHSATADYSQPNWNVTGSIDGDLKTGWAIGQEFGKSHAATFQTERPSGFPEGTRLTFRLIQNYGRTRTIGRLRLSALTGKHNPRLDKAIAKIVAKPADKRSAEERKKLTESFLQTVPELQQAKWQLEKNKKLLAAIKPATTLVMVEIDKPRTNKIFVRGEFLRKGDSVEADVPSVLQSLPENVPRNRLALAGWLTRRDNPLVARVQVNHWWTEIFGRGLVRTGEDFGTQGEPPSHPELLDWLAVEFMEGGWSMKQVHKLIVMSATYQQDSRVTSELLARDPQNVLLARAPRVRLPAELIRDNGLAISGLLSTKMAGPPIYPPQPPGLWNQTGRNEPKFVADRDENRFRRGIYVVWRRAAPYPSFITFDAPDRMKCVVERSRTNSPMQALTLMNDEVYVEMAKALAARVIADRPHATNRERIKYAFQLCTARQPRTIELDFLEKMYQDELVTLEREPAVAAAIIGKFQLPGNLQTPGNTMEWAAWFCIANTLLNLDETITNG